MPLFDGVSLFGCSARRHIQFPFGKQIIQIGAQQIGVSRSFTCLRAPIFRSQTDSHDVTIAIQTPGFAGLLQCGASGGRHFFREFQVAVTLFHLERYAPFQPLNILFGPHHLSFPFS